MLVFVRSRPEKGLRFVAEFGEDPCDSSRKARTSIALVVLKVRPRPPPFRVITGACRLVRTRPLEVQNPSGGAARERVCFGTSCMQGAEIY